MIRSDAWDEKPEVHASTPEVQLMHEAEKQGGQHHFLPLSRPAPLPVGVAPAAKPYLTVGPRQQAVHFYRRAQLLKESNWLPKIPNFPKGLIPAARRPPMLALPRRQSLNPPSGHANRPCTSPEGPQLPGGPCRRLFHSVQIEICRESGHKK